MSSAYPTKTHRKLKEKNEKKREKIQNPKNHY
jgi:hypothetical protein